MSDKKNEKWLTTDYPQIVFENTQVGRLKKELFDAPMSKIKEILKEYEVPENIVLLRTDRTECKITCVFK